MEIIEALNDLSRGVFVDPEAAAVWREHYLAALRLNLEGLKKTAILERRKGWNARAAKDPGILFSRLGPQIPCTAKSVTIRLEAFGEDEPLLFDINTAEEGVLRMVPAMNDDLLNRWVAERSRQPFTSLADFEKRVAGAPACR